MSVQPTIMSCVCVAAGFVAYAAHAETLPNPLYGDALGILADASDIAKNKPIPAPVVADSSARASVKSLGSVNDLFGSRLAGAPNAPLTGAANAATGVPARTPGDKPLAPIGNQLNVTVPQMPSALQSNVTPAMRPHPNVAVRPAIVPTVPPKAVAPSLILKTTPAR